MNENKPSTKKDWIDPDDAPDLSTPYWRKKFEAAPVKRGRPPSERPKVSTTIRLDPDVIDALKEGGKGWQTRANDLLRKGLGLAPGEG